MPSVLLLLQVLLIILLLIIIYTTTLNSRICSYNIKYEPWLVHIRGTAQKLDVAPVNVLTIIIIK